ncbi:MAG: hypothetical protein PF693_10525 [Spirochaetia bacterium]|jgi:hypothetical protein|nr:hypothetical protein [Spirochaetia bacterium]
METRIESKTGSINSLLRAPVEMDAVPRGNVIAHQLRVNIYSYI